MALSDTDIANQALIMIGSAPINSLNDSTNQGISVKTLYFAARDGLLREIPWNFARKQVALNQLAAVPVNLNILPNANGPGNTVYTGAFALPGDFLRMYRFSPQSAHWRLISVNLNPPNGGFGLAVITDAIPASVGAPLFGTQPPNADGSDDLPGGVAFTQNVTQLGCEYIARVRDPNQFDALFVECLATKLALQLAIPLAANLQIVQEMRTRYGDIQQGTGIIGTAAYTNGGENWPDQLYDLAVVDVRYGYSGYSITTGV
jgi:hypothetical protein